jgi:hypothetical protein
VGAIARAAHRADVPDLGLPNGSGLAFTQAGGVSENARAASVIWKWVAPGKRVIVWPPAFVGTSGWSEDMADY